MPLNTKGLVPRIWKWVKRIFIFLFFLQLFYILLLKWVNPPITLTQLGSVISGEGLKRDYVRMKDISPYAKLAVICSEDQLFPDHDGFDFKSIEKAMKHNQKSKSLHGASTISQQVAKNVFLWQGRSWVRKALEVYFTFMIELIWGKKRILEMYLNVSEMGKGIYGIEAAARHTFSKPARNLTRAEAAMIAASLPNPKVYTVHPMSRRVATRYPWIVDQMGELQDDTDVQKLLQ
ncbi:MAG: monofunctional biosynthetic peptidoglycan transglycosylase [Bacteroidota bacterium]|nr:monofunctional biosynthetic peptidoglycan transglycosylase [Bacteroidota bacterium]MDP4214673.1 monofunctional biosynthetic peptidoglycan transglycosylase [Bacteroidota bacterium]MDP4244356.1 monofunctional biosynthetic peptidoglycan transglycosylase [Bacteroidota bacterium]MDP4254263.1 monofunctional biosynthetic peptidoglycan transglycosylase [Bacteroidota bacterium]MDP4258918.1 monofunctional biosynthetic peptidoglycan transglycosylase [Bacteroidota bacterium]